MIVALVLWEARGALPVFGIAVALAFLFDPPVTALNRRFRIPRLVGILLVYVVVVVTLIGLGFLLIPPLFDQIRRFLEDLPTLASQFIAWEQAIVDWLTALPLPEPIRKALDTVIKAGKWRSSACSRRSSVPCSASWLERRASWWGWSWSRCGSPTC